LTARAACHRRLGYVPRHTGVHGLPLIGSGDWNDGMSRVGIPGKGESVWLAFFRHEVLRQFSGVGTCCRQTLLLEVRLRDLSLH
jgi:cyclic beta-1,2-glucan synthetase